MFSNKIRYLVVFAAVIAGEAALGQATETSAAEDPEFKQARALLQAGRKDIIRDEIRFTDAEAEKFWPAYEKYRSDVLAVRDRHAMLVTDYLKAYREGTVSARYANTLIDDYLDIKSDLLKVQKKHLRHFRKALPARKAARFYQLENKLDVELEAQLALFVPLIDPV